MVPERDSGLPWRKFASELIGTALLLLLGLSLVIFMFGTDSPGAAAVPDMTLRMIISGFLFGAVGGSIALSPVGKVSGAHINPAVTLGFWLMGKMTTPVALGFVVAQLAGGILGCVPLPAWGAMGRSISFGVTVPGSGYSLSTVVLGEAITTFGLISSLCIFIGFRMLRPYTPFMIPFLYGLMVPLESPISGTSTNPARSLGPSVVSGVWDGWWIYWVGPLIGTLVSISIFSFLGKRIEEAKLYHFESDQRKIFRTQVK
jgi:aquaporin Z